MQEKSRNIKLFRISDVNRMQTRDSENNRFNSKCFSIYGSIQSNIFSLHQKINDVDMPDAVPGIVEPIQ